LTGTDVFAEVEALGVVPVVEIKDVAANYRRLPHVFAVGGTWIAPRSDIAEGRWEEIAERARSVVTLSQSVQAS
jgi:2-keto-3-deoxy-6-phosphogluconate aldolase